MYILIGVVTMLAYYYLSFRKGKFKDTLNDSVMYTISIGLFCLTLWPVVMIIGIITAIRSWLKEK